jgi:hypothetical protein
MVYPQASFYKTEIKMEQQLGLNAAGVIFLVAAWGFILATTIFCFKRVLGSQGQKK